MSPYKLCSYCLDVSGLPVFLLNSLVRCDLVVWLLFKLPQDLFRPNLLCELPEEVR